MNRTYLSPYQEDDLIGIGRRLSKRTTWTRLAYPPLVEVWFYVDKKVNDGSWPTPPERCLFRNVRREITKTKKRTKEMRSRTNDGLRHATKCASYEVHEHSMKPSASRMRISRGHRHLLRTCGLLIGSEAAFAQMLNSRLGDLAGPALGFGSESRSLTCTPLMCCSELSSSSHPSTCPL